MRNTIMQKSTCIICIALTGLLAAAPKAFSGVYEETAESVDRRVSLVTDEITSLSMKEGNATSLSDISSGQEEDEGHSTGAVFLAVLGAIALVGLLLSAASGTGEESR